MRNQITAIIALFTAVMASVLSAQTIRVLRVPDTQTKNEFYIGNREPLLPSPLIKLPIGAIRPSGWLRRQLELEADGLTGHLEELSQYLKKEDNAWLSPEGKGHSPWEELPYWLKGFGDLGYILNDPRIIQETRVWIEGAISSQREDGFFGPRDNLRRIRGTPDLWQHMVMLNALQSYYEFTADKRVLDLMTGFFRWEISLPDEEFLEPFWQHHRGSDNLASVYWLYNYTGDAWLLELAEKIHRNTAEWTEGVADWHNVNIVQAFRGPAVYYQQTKDPCFLAATDRNYAAVWGLYGQVPGGMFGGDEYCRQGYYDPRQAVETCGIVEFMLSCEMLAKITGLPQWLDRCEDVAFNMFPATMTADLKAHHYLTAPNLIQCDSKSKWPGLTNSGEMLSYNPEGHRCCQHNVSHGWPYYAEHLWMATPGNGLAAAIYADCEVRAKVGCGKEICIQEKTLYPFDETILLTINTDVPVEFPLYLRIPAWCEKPQILLNAKTVQVAAEPQTYVLLQRTWTTGDIVKLHFPASIELKYWPLNRDSVSVVRGPLTYSLQIAERYQKYAGTDRWPALEVFPDSPWNYGLLLDDTKSAGEQFVLTRQTWPADNQPFTLAAAPIKLTASARKIPNWKANYLNLADTLQPSPVRSEEPVEPITLIPMGCARLRISAFPWINDSPNSHDWNLPSPKPYYIPGEYSDTGKPVPEDGGCDALSDGVVPKRSDDDSVGRFTWYPKKGTEEWVRYIFPQPRAFHAVEVFWYDNNSYARIPARWKVQYLEGANWKDVPNPSEYAIEKDRFNRTTFDEVTTSSLRLVVTLQKGRTAAILEWKVE